MILPYIRGASVHGMCSEYMTAVSEIESQSQSEPAHPAAAASPSPASHASQSTNASLADNIEDRCLLNTSTGRVHSAATVNQPVIQSTYIYYIVPCVANASTFDYTECSHFL